MPIVSSTSALRDAVVAGNDRDFAEEIAIVPMLETSQYKSRTPDPDRPAFSVQGILRIEMSSSDLSGPGRDDWATQVPAGMSMLKIDRVAYPASLELRKGDQITAIKRVGEPQFLVEQADPHGRSRLHIILSRL